MVLRKVFIPRGFSLIEITVVLGMFAIVGSLALLMSMQSYSGYSFHTTQQLLVTTLQKARSEALANVCVGTSCTDGVSHGVHIEPDELVLFQGNVYDPNNLTNVHLPLSNAKITINGNDIIFAPLTASVSVPGDILITDAKGRVSTTTVGAEGQISWTN
jgi:prepilin-type N-terminal cleavage/methylation domain-containing protein